MPLCKVTHSVNLAIADGFAYLGPQPWDTETFDTLGMHSTTVNNSRITCQAAGKYLLGALWNYTTSAAGDYGVRLRKNGAGGAGEVALGANGNFNVSIPCLVVDDLVVGDFFEVMVVQKTGAGLTSDSTGCEFWATRLGS